MPWSHCLVPEKQKPKCKAPSDGLQGSKVLTCTEHAVCTWREEEGEALVRCRLVSDEKENYTRGIVPDGCPVVERLDLGPRFTCLPVLSLTHPRPHVRSFATRTVAFQPGMVHLGNLFSFVCILQPLVWALHHRPVPQLVWQTCKIFKYEVAHTSSSDSSSSSWSSLRSSSSSSSSSSNWSAKSSSSSSS